MSQCVSHLCFKVGALAETPDPLVLGPSNNSDVLTRCCWVPPSPSPALAFASSALLGENVVRAPQKSTKDEEVRGASCADQTDQLGPGHPQSRKAPAILMPRRLPSSKSAERPGATAGRPFCVSATSAQLLASPAPHTRPAP